MIKTASKFEKHQLDTPFYIQVANGHSQHIIERIQGAFQLDQIPNQNFHTNLLVLNNMLVEINLGSTLCTNITQSLISKHRTLKLMITL